MADGRDAPSTGANLYDNCVMLSPEGVMMCRMSRRKCNWYTSRSLAKIVCEKPHTIQLTFRPAGLGAHNDEFYLKARPNICAVCGTTEMLTKHHCIPYCIRRRFPAHLKDHASHDVVPLCRVCHDIYETVAERKKRELKDTYGDKEFKARRTAYGYIRTVLKHSDRIPLEKCEWMRAEIERVYGARGDEELRLVLATHRRPSDSELWDRIVRHTDIPACIIEWRRHFIETMKPKYLPDGWSVDGRIGI